MVLLGEVKTEILTVKKPQSYFPCISKIFEVQIKSLIIGYLETKHFLNDFQPACRKGRSENAAVTDA